MTDSEFVASNKGLRGFYAFLVFVLAVGVGMETGSLVWFWLTLMAGCVLRFAAVAAILDRADVSHAERELVRQKGNPVKSDRPNPA